MKKFLLIFLFSFSLLSSDIFLGVNLEGMRFTKDMLLEVQDEVGFSLGFVNFFLQWPKSSQEMVFPESSLSSIWKTGAVPCISWEPQSYDKQVIFFEDILSHKYDSYLQFFSDEIKKWEKPLIIRFAHEMNLSSYHWGVKLQNYDKNYPALYQKTFRYIVSFFKKNNVKNVFFAFCPNCESVPKTKWNSYQNYYPGSEWVDLLGLDGYNFDSKSFKEIFTLPFEEMKRINSNKPFFIFETATENNKKIWIEEALDISRKWKVKALLWFQINKEKNWKITKNENEVFKNYKTSSSQKWIMEEYEKK